MPKIVTYLLSFLLLSVVSFGQSDYQQKRELRRWLLKKPIIEEIVINIYPADSVKDMKPAFSKSKIGSHLFSKPSNFLRAIKKDRSRRIQRETMARDTSEVKYLYFTNGFLGVTVNEIFEKLEDTTKARIIININEGRQFFYGQINIAGMYEPRFNAHFNKITAKLNGRKPLNPFDIQQAIYNIKTTLANNGYPYAQAVFGIDTLTNGDQANINFLIDADSLVHFGGVRITGSEKYDTGLVKRELTFEKGDVYRRRDIIETQKRLLGTGYFLTLRLESEKPDTLEPAKKLNPDFILNLREKNAHYVSIKTGAEQDSIKDLAWSIGASWGKRNFLKSRNLELSARAAFVIFSDWRLLEQVYKVSLSEPWFMGIKMPLTLSGQIEPGLPAPVLPYKKRTWSISASSIKRIGEKLKLLYGLQYEHLNIYDIDTDVYGDNTEAEIQIKQEEGISVRRKFYFNAIRDSRNSIFIPTKGSYSTFRFEYVGGFLGGDDSFYLMEGSWSRYQKLWPGWISASRIKSGFVQEMKESPSVPPDDRFYIGGANTIRGFDEKDLGVLNGSDIILIINQEFRFPIIGKFWGSIFTDIGNGYRYRENIKLKNLAISYGLGIQFISPAGPIRLDYARRVRVKGIESGDKIHFTILYAF